MSVRHFTSNETAKEREQIKVQFAETDPYQALIAIKCLDEGVNIPSIKTAFILASSTNPKEYIQFLQRAGNNDDTEVVHYAVTAMVEISKENDYKLQDFERQYSLNPDDHKVLAEYTEFLWSCLSQNLMQGQVEVLNRELYSNLMQKKLGLNTVETINVDFYSITVKLDSGDVVSIKVPIMTPDNMSRLATLRHNALNAAKQDRTK